MKNKKFVCEGCGSTSYKSRVTAYPVPLPPPGPRAEVGRVPVRVCSNCSHMTPTEKGWEKIQRCMGSAAAIFKRHGVDLLHPQKTDPKP